MVRRESKAVLWKMQVLGNCMGNHWEFSNPRSSVSFFLGVSCVLGILRQTTEREPEIPCD